MYHNSFRITVLVTAIAIILAACAAPTIEQQPIASVAPATEAVPTVTELAPTNTPEATATQVVLGVIEGRIAFQSDRDGNNEIYVMNGDGSGLINLTNDPSDDYLPVWSPDGKRILFSSTRDGNWEIYMMNADGSAQTNLTNNPANDGDMNWSPDGTQIVFN